MAAPITAIPLSGSVRTRALSSYRLDELADTSLLFDLPISPFIGTTLLKCNLIDCRQPFGFTIGDAVAAGAMLGSATLGDLQPGLSGLAVADLVGTHPDFTESALRTFVGAITLTLAGAEAAGLGVDGVPVQLLDAYDTTTLSEARLLFSGWRLVDIGGLAAGLETSDLDAALAAWKADQTATGPELTIGDLTRKLPVADTGPASLRMNSGPTPSRWAPSPMPLQEIRSHSPSTTHGRSSLRCAWNTCVSTMGPLPMVRST